MEIDPDKQFVEEEEVVIDVPNFEDKPEAEVIIEPKKEITQYGLVAKVIRNNVVILWEWEEKEKARSTAKKVFEGML